MNIKTCQTCGRDLTPGQIAKHRRNCSNKCRIAGLNCADLNKEALREPDTEAEYLAFYAQIAQGKLVEAAAHIALKVRWTPTDESPAAERRLRDGLGVGELVEEFA